MIGDAPHPISVFLSYAHEDRPWCDQLRMHLGGLEHTGRLRAFDDRQIWPGDEWDPTIKAAIDAADIIVLVVSPFFLGSKYCTTIELRRSLARRGEGVRLLPVIADYCDWESLPIDAIQATPLDAQGNVRPLSSWSNVNEPLAGIARSIRETIGELERRVASPSTEHRWPELRPPRRCLGRDDELSRLVATLTAANAGHAIVVGGPGIGKSTLTRQAASHAAVVARFGPRRCLVSLERADRPEAVGALIQEALGLTAHVDPWPEIERELRANAGLIVLDNLETPWLGREAAMEAILARLTAIPGLVLLASVRGGQAPHGVQWTLRLELRRLLPPHDRELLLAAAADLPQDDQWVKRSLDVLDGIPLAIELFGAGAEGEGTLALAWHRWTHQRTSMLATGREPDRLSSLDVSLDLSLASPRMTAAARRLYAVLGRLPEGLALSDAEGLLPADGEAAAAALIAARLCWVEQDRLRMLVPVREHAGRQPLLAGDRGALIERYVGIARQLSQLDLPLIGGPSPPSGAAEIGNMEAVLEMAASDHSPVAEEARVVSRRELAILSSRVARVRMTLGNLAKAEQGFRRGIDMLATVVTAAPDDAELQHELSTIWNAVGYLRQLQGRLHQALAAYEDGRRVAEGLVASDPANALWRRDLSVSLSNIGEVRAALGDLAGALDAYEQDLAIARELAASNPLNKKWQRDLSVSLNKLGHVRKAEGNLDAALAAYAQARDIRVALASAEPSDLRWQRDLLVSDISIGNVHMEQLDLAGALEAYVRAREIAERLTGADPANSQWQRDLSIAWNNIGDVYQAHGEYAQALRAYEEARSIRVRLTGADPENTLWQRDLAVTSSNIADLHRVSGDFPRALQAIEDAAAIARRLVSTDPANTDWQQFLATVAHGAGDLHRASGQAAAARDAYERARAIRLRLVGADPGHAAWQQELAATCHGLGLVREAARDLVGALHAYEEARAIRRSLATAAPNDVRRQRDLAESLDQIGNVLRALGNTAASDEAAQGARAIAARLPATAPAQAP